MPWGSWGGTLPGPAGGVPWWGGGTLAGEGYPGGGVPWQGVPCQGGTLVGGGYPGQGGTPLGGYPVRINIGSTWYMAGGMPLAFTQEDFLVTILTSRIKLH